MPSIDSVKIRIENFQTVENNPHFQEAKDGSFDIDKQGKQRMRKLIRTNNKFRKSIQAQGKYVMKYWTHTSSFNRGIKYLYLEVSLPKLLFGENYSVVTENDFETIVDAIVAFLSSIQVAVSRVTVRDAIVVGISFCENVSVKEFGTAESVLQRVLFQFKNRFRSTFQPRYNKDGRLTHLELYNFNSHVVAYDKKQEISDQGFTDQEKVVYKKLSDAKEEVIRFELSLHTPTAVNQFISKIYKSKSSDFTLAEVFRPDIGASLLKTEINHIYNHPLKSLVSPKNLDYEQLNAQIKIFIEEKYMEGKLKSQLYELIGILRSEGWKGVRLYLKQNTKSRSTRQRRIRQLKEIEAKGIEFYVPLGEPLDHILKHFGLRQGQTTLF